MAQENVIPSAAGAYADSAKPAPQFIPYENGEAAAVAQVDIPGVHFSTLAQRTQEIARGLSTVVQMLEDNGLRSGFENEHPLMSEYHAGSLLRMTAVVLDMLADDAESDLRAVYHHRTPEGIAEAARLSRVVRQ